MTREEALVQLRLGPGINEDVSEEYNEAVDMAIEVLEQQPNEDCVSRKAVLDGFASIAKAKAKSDAQKSLMGRVIFFTEHLPSINPQPSERTEERTETHERDCISRQFMYDMGATCIAARNKDGDLVALGALDILPSVAPQSKEKPQQKTGHWIEHKHGGIEHIECSECGIWFLKANLIRKSYCPNCGSCNGDMIKNIMKDITKQ